MQTFLPYARFDASAAVLDDLRLGKQRVETLQILRALTFPTYKGWRNHPATAMWRGFTAALATYGLAVCAEWERRGRADAVAESLLAFTGGVRWTQDELRIAGRLPPWLGRPALHTSHRASLVRKLPEHYRRHFPDADPDLPYDWPPPLFPRWPVRHRARSTATAAAALLGLDALDPAQRDVVAAVRAGRSVRVPAEDGPLTAVLTALCRPAPTVWVTAGPVDPSAPPSEELRPAPQPTRTGRVSPSIARPPTAEDLEAVQAEATTAPWLLAYRAEDLRDRRVRAAVPAPGLVVVTGGSLRARFPGVPVLSIG